MKKMLFVVGAILLSGCASSYKPNSIFGGFDETMLSPDTFRISVSGNAFTSGGRVYDFALLRAAELSIQNQCPYFVVLDQENRVKTSRYISPSSAHTNASVSAYGNYAYGQATTTYSGGTISNIEKPVSSITVQCFKENPQNVKAFDAVWLEQSLKAKYKVQ